MTSPLRVAWMLLDEAERLSGTGGTPLRAGPSSGSEHSNVTATAR
ncbi:MAG TPA: hypothetical protein VG963_27365 [Polyangiaceae bacterium]|nr:hypothetical protein [Polyangiaceae bacterium]